MVAFLNAVFGTLVGALAGYFPRLDTPAMRVNDALMAFPAVLLAIGITAVLGPSTTDVTLALAIVYIPRTARLVRASVIVVREMEYVQAARACGASHWHILRRHILPNCMAPLIVQLSFLFAYAVLSEAVLSFLGLGAVPPTPTWGNIMSEGRQYMREAPWIIGIPGLALMVTVLGLNLLGDGLRDVLDPAAQDPAVTRPGALPLDPTVAMPQAPLLEVEGLTTVFNTQSGDVTAVEDVTFAIAAGRDPRHRGRVRQRQIGHRAHHHGPAAAAAGAHRTREKSASRAPSSPPSPSAACAPSAARASPWSSRNR